jgi:hypothetical protein
MSLISPKLLLSTFRLSLAYAEPGSSETETSATEQQEQRTRTRLAGDVPMRPLDLSAGLCWIAVHTSFDTQVEGPMAGSVRLACFQ